MSVPWAPCGEGEGHCREMSMGRDKSGRGPNSILTCGKMSRAESKRVQRPQDSEEARGAAEESGRRRGQGGGGAGCAGICGPQEDLGFYPEGDGFLKGCGCRRGRI